MLIIKFESKKDNNIMKMIVIITVSSRKVASFPRFCDAIYLGLDRIISHRFSSRVLIMFILQK